MQSGVGCNYLIYNEVLMIVLVIGKPDNALKLGQN